MSFKNTDLARRRIAMLISDHSGVCVGVIALRQLALSGNISTLMTNVLEAVCTSTTSQSDSTSGARRTRHANNLCLSLNVQPLASIGYMLNLW
jgi:hypothetical protein